ncbi:4-hydroxy-3-methylbut-2-enyl diphosphate reductase [Tannerella forsythia]|uniref:4-hydroxy-3-methylbut-2-enyl diphosphate reductase n=1 Tax=Tannerella forsythia TaxID=28112 RepID=UPI0028F00758|nr:4-hydroxy-3-methylbut-2-enyl diphosphate reductase [Tannerella forsythia]
MVEVTIDRGSGFCFGVVKAIQSAERELKQTDELYSLGDLVHNSLEMERLKALGLHTIGHADLAHLRNRTVLLRAHGEPPSTYALAQKNQIKIIDATCPVVLQLQKRIHRCYQETKEYGTQLVIYGKKGHAEVNGLVGQTEGTAIVIEKLDDIEKIDFHRDIILFSQTTKPLDGFGEVVEAIRARISSDVTFQYFDTICRQVANRLPNIRDFALQHDCIYFVAGKKSSNGQMLFEQCLQANPHSVFITSAADIAEPLPEDIRSVGICGATSTPKWLMEEVAERVKMLNP